MGGFQFLAMAESGCGRHHPIPPCYPSRYPPLAAEPAIWRGRGKDFDASIASGLYAAQIKCSIFVLGDRQGWIVKSQRFGSAHTEKKLQLVTHYLKRFTTALKNQAFAKIYVDAFAGTGAWQSKDAVPNTGSSTFQVDLRMSGSWAASR
jgi:hypothetical protein